MVAVTMIVVGLIFMALDSQSPTRLYWTGQQVTGTVHDGIVFYRVHGQKYTVDDATGGHPDGSRMTVYVDRNAPSHALLYRPVKWVDAGAVLVWFVGAGVSLMLGALRRTRGRRERRDLERTLGL